MKYNTIQQVQPELIIKDYDKIEHRGNFLL